MLLQGIFFILLIAKLCKLVKSPWWVVCWPLYALALVTIIQAVGSTYWGWPAIGPH